MITSNRSSLAEVAGDAALLVDPTDVDGLRQAIEQVLDDDDDEASRLRAAGPPHAARFDWNRTATAMFDLYAAILGRNVRGEAR